MTLTSVNSGEVRGRRRLHWSHVFMATYGGAWAVSVDIGARIYAAEIVAIICFLVMRNRALEYRNPDVARLIYAYFVWLLAIVMSDLINQTPIYDTLRAASAPVLGGISFLITCLAIREKPSSLFSFFVCIGVGKALHGDPLYADKLAEYQFSLESIALNSNYFKVRFEPFVTPAVLFASTVISGFGLIYSGFLFLIVASLYIILDARSMGLVMLVSGFLCILLHFHVRAYTVRGALAGILVVFFCYIAFQIYVDRSLTGGDHRHGSQQISRLTNPYNPIELLFTGRSEWYVIPRAIYERPVFGWGSWARDEAGEFSQLRLESLGQADQFLGDTGDGNLYIPVHSVVGSAWVWSGTLGGGAMVWVFMIILSMAKRLSGVQSAFLPATIYLTVQMIWHFFFSPMQMVRIFFPVAIGALVWAVSSAARNRNLSIVHIG